MSDILKPLIGIAANRPLTRAEAEAAFNALFEGEGTPAQMGGFLMALRTRGETVDEYAAAASVMRSKCNAVKAPPGAMDIVGTGGDGNGTLNISTATAFVVADGMGGRPGGDRAAHTAVDTLLHDLSGDISDWQLPVQRANAAVQASRRPGDEPGGAVVVADSSGDTPLSFWPGDLSRALT